MIETVEKTMMKHTPGGLSGQMNKVIRSDPPLMERQINFKQMVHLQVVNNTVGCKSLPL